MLLIIREPLDHSTLYIELQCDYGEKIECLDQ